MNLFAITSHAGARIIRLPLAQSIQNELAENFKEQETAFMDGITEEHEFDGRYNPELGELLKISDFDDVDGMVNAINGPLTIPTYDPEEHPFTCIRGLFSGYVENEVPTVLIQLFEQRRILARKGLTVFYSNNTFLKMEQSGLTVDTKLLAILKGNVLKFQSFHFLRRVFDLDDLFHEATDPDVQKFTQHASIAVANPAAFVQQADMVIRKKIAFIQQSQVLEKYTGPELQAAAAQFGITVQLDGDNRLVIPGQRAQIKELLRFLDEDYFESVISKKRYVSNSKRVAD
jgi:hypothetical protein